MPIPPTVGKKLGASLHHDVVREGSFSRVMHVDLGTGVAVRDVDSDDGCVRYGDGEPAALHCCSPCRAGVCGDAPSTVSSGRTYSETSKEKYTVADGDPLSARVAISHHIDMRQPMVDVDAGQSQHWYNVSIDTTSTMVADATHFHVDNELAVVAVRADDPSSPSTGVPAIEYRQSWKTSIVRSGV